MNIYIVIVNVIKIYIKVSVEGLLKYAVSKP